MVFTLAMDYDLLQFLRVFDYYCRILKMYLVKGFPKLFIVAFALCLYGCPVFGFRELYAFIFPVITRNIECMAGFCVLEFDKGAYIAGGEFRNPYPVFASTYIKL